MVIPWGGGGWLAWVTRISKSLVFEILDTFINNKNFLNFAEKNVLQNSNLCQVFFLLFLKFIFYFNYSLQFFMWVKWSFNISRSHKKLYTRNWWYTHTDTKFKKIGVTNTHHEKYETFNIFQFVSNPEVSPRTVWDNKYTHK